MRVHVHGEAALAGIVQHLVDSAGLPSGDRVDVEVLVGDGPHVEIDGVDGPLEQSVVRHVAELATSGKVLLHRRGGVSSDRRLKVWCPPPDAQALGRAIARACFEFGRSRPAPLPRWWQLWSLILPIVCVLSASPAVAQVQVQTQTGTGGGGGGGGAATIANGADVNAGATTDSAMTTDTTGTMSAKLRGMIKWAFERMPASLGQKPMTGSLPVVVASDQSAIPVSASTLPLPTGAATSANQTIDTDGTSAPSPLNVTLIGGVDGPNNISYAMPMVAASWAKPTSNERAVVVTVRNGLETNGNTVTTNDFISVGGVKNDGTQTAYKFQFAGDWQITDPGNAFGAVTKEYGQQYIDNGNIQTVGSRMVLSSRKVVKTAALFDLTPNTFTGTVKPVVSLDGGSTYKYVSAINASSGAVVTTLTDSAATGTYVIPFCAGATNCGWEVTARTLGSVSVYISANSQGTNGIFASVVGTVGVSGTVPVTGTFWQTTQPVSASSLPLPSNAAQETGGNLATLAGAVSSSVLQDNIKQFGGTNVTIGQQLAAASMPVVLPAAQITTLTPPAAITGYALDATLTGGTAQAKITNGTNVADVKAASTAAGATDKALVVAISPNNTVPVSLASAPTTAVTNAGLTNIDVALSTRLKPADTLAGVTTVGAVTAITNALPAGSAIIGKVGIDQTTPGTTNGVQVNAALPAGTNAIGKLAANSGVIIGDVNVVAAPTLTKGTQGSTGFSTQDLKDAGRTAVIYYATAAASGTTGTETAITLTKASGTSATSTAVSFVITSGKRYRIQQVLVSAVGHATGTTQATTFSFRINTAGAVVTTSTPIVWKGRVQTPATSLAYQQISLPIPDGYEILGDGTLQFGITANAVFVTNAPTWDVTIIGYEY